MQVSIVKDATGRKLGSIETDSLGNQVGKDQYGRVVSRYYVSSDTTRDHTGRLVAFGNVVSSFIFILK